MEKRAKEVGNSRVCVCLSRVHYQRFHCIHRCRVYRDRQFEKTETG